MTETTITSSMTITGDMTINSGDIVTVDCTGGNIILTFTKTGSQPKITGAGIFRATGNVTNKLSVVGNATYKVKIDVALFDIDYGGSGSNIELDKVELGGAYTSGGAGVNLTFFGACDFSSTFSNTSGDIVTGTGQDLIILSGGNFTLAQNQTVGSWQIEVGGTTTGGGYSISCDSESVGGIAFNHDGVISGALDLTVTTAATTGVDLAGSAGNVRNMTVNNSNHRLRLLAPATLDGNLTITSGQFPDAATTAALTVGGNVSVVSGAVLGETTWTANLPIGGNLTNNGTFLHHADQTMTLTGNLTYNSNGITMNISATSTIDGSITLTDGTLIDYRTANTSAISQTGGEFQYAGTRTETSLAYTRSAGTTLVNAGVTLTSDTCTYKGNTITDNTTGSDYWITTATGTWTVIGGTVDNVWDNADKDYNTSNLDFDYNDADINDTD